MDQLGDRGPGPTFYRVVKKGVPEDAQFKSSSMAKNEAAMGQWEKGRTETEKWARSVLGKENGKHEDLRSKRT